MKENVGKGLEGLEVKIEEKQVGEKFLPFRHCDLAPKNFGHKLTEKGGQILFVAELFNFRGVPVTISIVTEDFSEGLENVTTPLGEAKEIISFKNDGVVAEEHPVILGVDTCMDSIEKYRDIKDHVLEFDLGGKNYHLRLEGEDSAETIEQTIIQNGRTEAFDYSLKDEKGKDKYVLLPLNLSLLSNITARIVKKDFPRTMHGT